MLEQSKISLDCPLCGASIFQPVGWFRQSYQSCPNCEKPIPAGRFDQQLHDIEQAFDASIEEQLNPAPQKSCCGSKKDHSCCGH